MRGIGGILGVDSSLTATGLCYRAEDETLISETVKTGLKDPGRMTFISRYINDVVAEMRLFGSGVPLVAIESPSFGSRHSQAHKLGGLYWVILTQLEEMGVPWVAIPPRSLKKFVTGRGDASKKKVLVDAVERSGLEFDDDNQADAFGLYCMACELLGRAHPLRPVSALSREALQAIRLPRLGDFW